MQPSIERVIHIIACLYKYNAEVVINFSRNQYCYIYVGETASEIEVLQREVAFLIASDIIELEGGNTEPGFEIETYRLTEIAKEKLSTIIEKRSRQKKLLI